MKRRTRIVVFGFGTYLVSFVIGIVIGLIFGADFENASITELPESLWYAGMATTTLITYLAARWYFMDITIEPSAKEGLLFGLAIVGIGFLFDIFFLLPQIADQGTEELFNYFSHPFFVLTIFMVVAVSAIVGAREEQSRKELMEQ